MLILSLGQVHFEKLSVCVLYAVTITGFLSYFFWNIGFRPVTFRSACSNHNVYEKTLLWNIYVKLTSRSLTPSITECYVDCSSSGSCSLRSGSPSLARNVVREPSTAASPSSLHASGEYMAPLECACGRWRDLCSCNWRWLSWYKHKKLPSTK